MRLSHLPAKGTLVLRRAAVALLLTVATMAVAVGTPRPAAAATTGLTDAVVYIGQLGATAYTQTLDAVLDTEGQILATEEQIGIMADRIVYVTEISQNGAIQVIYLAASVLLLGVQDGTYRYWAPLIPVAVLPAGW